MTEREKMLSGKLYDCTDPELAAMRHAARKLCGEFNETDPDQKERREEILSRLLPRRGNHTFLNAPIFMDYGAFTTFGDRCYANCNLTILDCAPVTIGDDVFFGPGCFLLPPMHPMLASERRMRTHKDGSLYDLEYALPITIGNGCWIAGNVTICGGVTIGADSVIGAGSVVTRDIPPGVLAAGNPCRPIRTITKSDSVLQKTGLY